MNKTTAPFQAPEPPPIELPLETWARLFVIDDTNDARHRQIVAQLLADVEATR